MTGFPAGTLVLTDRGHVAIDQVRPGDLVLTERQRWQPVQQVIDHGPQTLARVRGTGHFGLRMAADQQLLVRHRGSKGLDDPLWRGVGDLDSTGHNRHDRWAAPANIPALTLPTIDFGYRRGKRNDLLPEHLDDPSWWWVLGMYAAEGSTSSSYGAGGPRNRTTWTVNLAVEQKMIAALDQLGLRWGRVLPTPDSQCVNVIVNSSSLTKYLLAVVGRLSAHKRLDPAVFGLNGECRAALFDGAITGDGYQRRGTWSYSTVSRALALDMRLLGYSLGHQASIHVQWSRGTQVILGRVSVCRDRYIVQGCQGAFRPRVRFEDGLAWLRVQAVEPDEQAPCYELVVADDGYVAEGVIAHGTRSASRSEPGVSPTRRPADIHRWPTLPAPRSLA